MAERAGSRTPPRAKHPLAWYMFRFWHGMGTGTFFRALRRHRFAVSPGKVPMALSIGVASLLNSAIAAYERRIFRRRIAAHVAAPPPIFILGHWRSGTTFLQELLACDPALGFPTTYRCFAAGHFLITESIGKRLLGGLIPGQRPMDDMETGWDRPMEDEFALMNLGLPSPYRSMMFPNDGDEDVDYLTLRRVSPEARERWVDGLRRLIARFGLADPRRLVLKSPTHTGRVRTLLTVAPDARFIHIARHPDEVYASTAAFWRAMNAEMALQDVRDAFRVHRRVVDWLRLMYDAYLEDRKSLPPDRLVELRYEELVADPVAAMADVYRQLDLGDFARAEPAIRAHLHRVAGYRTNRHALDPVIAVELRIAWRAYFEAFGYE
jgi:hypothetical protein